MQTIGLDEDNPIEVSKGFWARQFQEEPTSSQRKFDWAFGVVIPALCFYFDPIVFRGNYFGVAVFASYKPLAYTLGFVSIMAMTAFLLWGKRLRWLNAMLSGLFVVGAVVSFIFGVLLLPMSLLGLLILIGALGFTPLISGIVYARNAVRACTAAKQVLKTGLLIRTVIIAVLFSSIVPLTINREAQRNIETILNGNEGEMRSAAKKLEYISAVVNFDQLALHCLQNSRREASSERMLFIAEFYKRMTGDDVENSVYLMMD